jgi:hypothetical protein
MYVDKLGWVDEQMVSGILGFKTRAELNPKVIVSRAIRGLSSVFGAGKHEDVLLLESHS